eukprot:TRINITY_DN7044_c0_g1_i6.p1 TRINITY_DN7044_c0_g1~~TRINITY_DN7044_c0_g1_i6.p1  ORF type:complete len:155 (+),score=28.53 TRINITY_DN7044_c0_g1_i6:127-591(+)
MLQYKLNDLPINSNSFVMSTICILLLILCIAQGNKDVKVYTEEDFEERGPEKNDYRLAVKAGEKFAVQVKSNPTTGYMWHLANPGSLKLLTPASKDGKGEFIPPVVEEGVTGAPGVENYYFTPKGKGEETVQLEYQREWENKPIAVVKLLISAE